MSPLPPYRKLPGFSLGFRMSLLGASAQAYLGPDHLLLVEASGYSEKARAFDFSEIQAVQVWDHPEHRVWNGVLALLTAVLLLTTIPLWGGELEALAWALSALGGACALALGWSLYSGPACRARLMLGGEWVAFEPWRRWKAAEAGLELLLPLLRESQAGLEQEPVGGERFEASAAPAATEAKAAAAREPIGTDPRALRNGRWALGLTAAAWCAAAFIDLAAFLDVVLTELSAVLTYTAYAGSVASLALSVRAGRGALRASLAATGIALLQFIGSIVYFVGAAFQGMNAQSLEKLIDLGAMAQDPIGAKFLLANAVSSLLAALIVLWGLQSLQEHR